MAAMSGIFAASRIFKTVLTHRKALLLPAYDVCLKCSHLFNLLDSRGAISVSERVKMIAQIRELVTQVAQNYVKEGEPE